MPNQSAPPIDSSVISKILGDSPAQLIDLVARRAQAENLRLFLVGGVIRDLLLNRRNLDLDFVLESDAIRFARALVDAYGGELRAHQPFGTATWTLDATLAEQLSLPPAAIPDHLDFARARSETYAHPAALPTVHPSSIERDLWRRDFSLNALALQLSPAPAAGALLDVCGGHGDLQLRLIRILHDRSFLDDPTRILRAIRFAVRYQFELEPKTAQLLHDALPTLGRVSGARLRSEIELILQEPDAAEIFRRLQDLGVLQTIHPAFRLCSTLQERLSALRESTPPWAKQAVEDPTLRWCLLLADGGANAAGAICRRLDMPLALTRSVIECARLVGASNTLGNCRARPSQIARLLEGAPEASLLAARIALSTSPVAQQNIDNYASTWRQQRPGVTGHDLLRMGLPPGPRYKTILEALRSAWIDGDITTPEDEAVLLRELLAKDD